MNMKAKKLECDLVINIGHTRQVAVIYNDCSM